jgi:NitT/TauT family transport system substrate-binding protein
MNKTRRPAIALLLLAALLTATACASAPAPSAAPTTAAATPAVFKYGKIKIQALGGGACGAPSYIAFEKGFFAEEGLDVELVSGTHEQLTTGLATGEFIVANGDFQFFPSIQNGLDLKVIGGLHKGCIKVVVPPNSPIKTAADLKGKRIGIDEPGGTPNAVASLVLANAGIDPSTGVTWVTYPLDQLTAAVDKGEVDAFAAWDPFGALAIKDNGYTALSDLSVDPLFAGKSCCFLYASGKQIAENPEKVAAIARAYQKAAAWIAANPGETAKIEIEKKYVAADDVAFLTDLLKSYNYEYTTDQAKGDVLYFATKLQDTKTGFLKEGTDVQAFTDSLYVDVFNLK